PRRLEGRSARAGSLSLAAAGGTGSGLRAAARSPVASGGGEDGRERRCQRRAPPGDLPRSPSRGAEGAARELGPGDSRAAPRGDRGAVVGGAVAQTNGGFRRTGSLNYEGRR